jgi:hypothetical protein
MTPALMQRAIEALEPFADLADELPTDRTWGRYPIANHCINRARAVLDELRAAKEATDK